MRARGFTLVELAIAAGLAGLLLTLAWPTLHDHLTSARRHDAMLSLERLQFAQARHHATHGLYASSLQALGTPARSLEGLYDIGLTVGPGDRYEAWARARADGAQARDADCAELRVRVEQGFATLGPSRQCWNR